MIYFIYSLISYNVFNKMENKERCNHKREVEINEIISNMKVLLYGSDVSPPIEK